jgi:uncharacterized protein YdeI (YjbR/CyaY-like superfamily)
MADIKRSPIVDEFMKKAEKWKAEYEKLREIMLDCGLAEDFKWGFPCYSYNDKNVALIHGFKEYCAILFFKGSLMKDPQGILIQQTVNVQAGRQIRFANLQEIVSMESVIKDYINEAIEVEKSGVEVDFKKTAEFAIPEELQSRFDANPALKAAFEALTPGRQRQYLFYFGEPKQSKTREARCEKCMEQILNGKGLND